MNYKTLMFETKNPFINLAFLLYEQDKELTKDNINLLYSLISSDLGKIYNLNETFYLSEVDYEKNRTIYKYNFFSLLSSLYISETLNFDDYKKLFNSLFDLKIHTDNVKIYDFNNINFKNQSELEDYIQVNNITSTKEYNHTFDISMIEDRKSVV